jgi:transitional endoplasmic reticulum ATPase
MRHHNKRFNLQSINESRLPIISEEQDLDELFILRKCSEYLIRLHRHPKMFTDESLCVLHWVLGEKIETLNDLIPNLLEKEDRDRFKDDRDEWMANIDLYPSKISHIIARMNTESRLKVELTVVSLLMKRKDELSGVGLSGLEERLNHLVKGLGLNDLEKEFIILFMIIHMIDYCDSLFLRELSVEKIQGRKYLKKILETDTQGLLCLLSGNLARIGIIQLSSDTTIRLDDDVLSFIHDPKSKNLFADHYRRVDTKNTIPLEFHLVESKQTKFLLKLLQKTRKTSSHILLYGTPGTGKTSFAYGIARELGIAAYEIMRDEDNKTVKRRTAITACMNIHHHNKGSLIIVDEADNLLNTKGSWFDRGETQDKGWLNDLLEKPGYRFVWITNRIHGIEDSVMRRFAYSIHFKPFDKRQRMHVWRKVLEKNRIKKGFGEKDIESLADHYPVSAGAVDMAIRKVKEVSKPSQKEFKEAVQMSLDAHITLLKGGVKPALRKNNIEENYSLEGLNIEGDINTIMTQVRAFDRYLCQPKMERSANMNLLFYGPPGTGKSELARYISHELQREMICKRASDIVSSWVGETERNIASTFQDAESQGTVLIIDEVDTFLFNRSRAQRSWEISFTNEFLTQMERYRGILVCTTNRMEDLDTAAIRRFNQKVGFNYLTSEGNVLFYEKLLSPLKDTPSNPMDREALYHIVDLSPGDFRVVRDRFSFYPKEEIAHPILIQALREEVATRNKQLRQGRRIGF